MKSNLSIEELDSLLRKIAQDKISSLPSSNTFSYENSGGMEDHDEEGEELDISIGDAPDTSFDIGNSIEEQPVSRQVEPIDNEYVEKPEPVIEKSSRVVDFTIARDKLGTEDFFKKPEDEKFSSVDEAVSKMTAQTIEDAEKDLFLKDCKDKVLKTLSFYTADNVKKSARRAYNSKDTDKQWNSKTMYKRDNLTVGGKDIEISRVKETPRWTLDLQDCTTNDDMARNFDQVRTKLTEEVINYFGGFRRIKRIYVSSLQLVINDVCYTPLLSDTLLSRLPFDSADYIRNGYLAPFFDWGYLYKMSNLSVLSFDDMDFIMTNVAVDLGKGRDFKPLSLFSICENLSVLDIAGEVITYPIQRDQETARKVRKIETESDFCRRFDNSCSAMYEKSKGVLEGVRGWTVNNLVSYAHNRGNKGIFKFTGGLLARLGVSAVAGTAELGFKSVGWTVKSIRGIIKGRKTSINDEDTENYE